MNRFRLYFISFSNNTNSPLGASFSTSTLDQALSTDILLSNPNPRRILSLNDILGIERKVEKAISTLTDVLAELHNGRDALSNLTNAFYAPHNIDTNDASTNDLTTAQKVYMPCQELYTFPKTTFSNGINPGVAVVELVASEDLRNVNKCNQCDKVFEDRLKLRNHSRIHKQTRKYKCEVCTLAFPVPSKLKEHMRTHTGERPYQCEICLRCFTKTSSLKRHQQLHKSPNTNIPSQLGALTLLLQDQVVQNMDQPLSPAFKEVQIENGTSISFHDNDAYLSHIESDISSAPGSP